MIILITILSAILMYCFMSLVLKNAFKSKLEVDNRISKLTDATEIQKDIKKAKGRKSRFKVKHESQIARQLELAGVLLRPEEFLLMWAGITLVPCGLLELFGGNILSVIAVGLVCLLIPPAIISRKKRKRMVKFEKQLGESLTIMSNSLKAGFTFNQAMQSIANDTPDPISSEFTKTLQEIKLGIPMTTAMENMTKRVDNYDLTLLVSAVLIQRKAGGNLSQVLDTISRTIKNRLKIKGEIRILTASGRTSGLIVGLLPVFIFGILMVINPEYIQSFFKAPIALLILGLALVLEVVGFVIIKKIVDIKF